MGSSFHWSALYGSQNQSSSLGFVALVDGERNWRFFYPHSTTIFVKPLKGIWILQSLQKSWRWKGLILKNVKTWCISMLSLVKHVVVEYLTLLMKITINNLNDEKAKTKFDLKIMMCKACWGLLHIISLVAVCSQFRQVQPIEGCFHL